MPSASPGVAGAGRLYQTNVSDLSTQLRRALEQFRGVTLIPFGWVAFFIFLYILLIGPGDYLLLKKVLKRMELTWITFPTIVVTVSVLAYYAAYAVKGNELRVNQVEIVDVDQPAGLVRGNTFLTLFSPQNRDYDISVVPLPLDARRLRQTGADSARAGAAPPGTEVILSWFGVPEPGFRRHGGQQPVPLRQRRLLLRAGRRGRGALRRPGPDLEHTQLHRPLVRPGPQRPACRRRPCTGRAPTA